MKCKTPKKTRKCHSFPVTDIMIDIIHLSSQMDIHHISIHTIREDVCTVPFLTVRWTAVDVVKTVLSTVHQYVPASDSWIPLMFTVKPPVPQSTRVILPFSTVAPGCTVASVSVLLLHGSLQKALLFLQASLCWHRNETSPPSVPSTFMSASAVHMATVPKCTKV